MLMAMLMIVPMLVSIPMLVSHACIRVSCVRRGWDVALECEWGACGVGRRCGARYEEGLKACAGAGSACEVVVYSEGRAMEDDEACVVEWKG